MRNAIILIFILICVFAGGVFTGYKLLPPEQIITEVEVIKNVDKIIYRDYSKIDCCEIAKRYDSEFMQIKYKVNSMNSAYTDMDLTWRLYERAGMQNVHVPVYQQGNWKFYAGLGIGAGIIGGLSYMVLR